MKPERFLLANSNDNDIHYIIHTESPKALIEVKDSHTQKFELGRTYSCILQNEVIPRYFTFSIAQQYDASADWSTILDDAWQWHRVHVLAA